MSVKIAQALVNEPSLNSTRESVHMTRRAAESRRVRKEDVRGVRTVNMTKLHRSVKI